MTDGVQIPQPLGEKVMLYLNPEAPELEDDLGEVLGRAHPPEWVAPFKQQWGELRATRWMSPEAWYQLTGRTFPSPEALYAFIDEVSNRLRLG